MTDFHHEGVSDFEGFSDSSTTIHDPSHLDSKGSGTMQPRQKSFVQEASQTATKKGQKRQKTSLLRQHPEMRGPMLQLLLDDMDANKEAWLRKGRNGKFFAKVRDRCGTLSSEEFMKTSFGCDARQWESLITNTVATRLTKAAYDNCRHRMRVVYLILNTYNAIDADFLAQHHIRRPHQRDTEEHGDHDWTEVTNRSLGACVTRSYRSKSDVSSQSSQHIVGATRQEQAVQATEVRETRKDHEPHERQHRHDQASYHEMIPPNSRVSIDHRRLSDDFQDLHTQITSAAYEALSCIDPSIVKRLTRLAAPSAELKLLYDRLPLDLNDACPLLEGLMSAHMFEHIFQSDLPWNYPKSAERLGLRQHMTRRINDVLRLQYKTTYDVVLRQAFLTGLDDPERSEISNIEKESLIRAISDHLYNQAAAMDLSESINLTWSRVARQVSDALKLLDFKIRLLYEKAITVRSMISAADADVSYDTIWHPDSKIIFPGLEMTWMGARKVVKRPRVHAPA